MGNFIFITLGTVAICFAVSFPYWMAMVIVALSKTDVFFTGNEEGQGKAIKRNGKFYKTIVTLEGYHTRGNMVLTEEEKKQKKEDETEKEFALSLGIHSEDVIPGKQKEPWWWNIAFTGGILKGIYWIGFPPSSETHKYRFSWVASEYAKGTEALVVKAREEEEIDHILTQDYVYLIAIMGAETNEAMPVNVRLAVTARSMNVYKSLFLVHRWLDAVANQVGSQVREYIGNHSYESIYKGAQVHSELLQESLKNQINWCKREYGIVIRLIQIKDIEPVDKKYLELTTKKFEAEQEGELTRIKADNEAYRIEKEALAKGKEIELTYGKMHTLDPKDGVKWLAIEKSKLTTYFEGGSEVKPVAAVTVGSGEPKQK